MKIATVIGARPQFIKAAPVSRALRAMDDGSEITEILIHTGQHYDANMSQMFFDELGLTAPDYNLGIGSGSHGWQTGQMLAAIEAILLSEKPDCVLTYGDTNSTLAAAVAAAKLHIPVAHVEAGLRSFNRRMPEELNRIVADQLSVLLFAPTETAVSNLAAEGMTRGVYLVGDVMQDALVEHLVAAENRSEILKQLDLSPNEYLLVTVHRAENTDSPQRLNGICEALRILSMNQRIVWPVHPRTRKLLKPGMVAPKISLIEPAGYLDMLMLEKGATAVLTDSGGVQKEARWLGVPCVTLRDETEWVETLQDGWNRLTGADPIKIVDAVKDIVRLFASRARMPELATGAAPKISQIIWAGFMSSDILMEGSRGSNSVSRKEIISIS